MLNALLYIAAYMAARFVAGVIIGKRLRAWGEYRR